MRKCKAKRYQIQQKARQNIVSISKIYIIVIVAQGMITFGYRDLVVKYSNRYQTFKSHSWVHPLG